MLLIGDIHGDLKMYERILKSTGSTNSVQVGDFGVGFPDYKSKYVYVNNFMKELNGNHRFIRGNHDNLSECIKCNAYIPDGYIENNIMFIGGATSIDKMYRKEGVDWWRDEELSYNQLNRLMDIYAEKKPEIMVTHECPNFLPKYFGKEIYPEKSITRIAFDQFFEIHKPEFWIFGHWHLSYTGIHDNTKFICLNVGEYCEV